jgi:chromosome partitioning protein
VIVYATYNIKGGVGKTSAAVNLAHLASASGLRTLIWDLDPQGAATFMFRVKAKVKGGGRGLVRGRTEVGGQIKGTDFELLDLLPADFSYRNLDLVLDGTKHPTRRLGRVLEPVEADYDLVVLDCPPSISLASENVLAVADTVLVPLIPAVLSVRTYGQLTSFVAKQSERAPDIVGFLSMVDLRRRLHRDVVEQLRSGPGRWAQASIPSSALVEQMASRCLPVTASHPRSPAAEAYRRLWSEVGVPGPFTDGDDGQEPRAGPGDHPD